MLIGRYGLLVSLFFTIQCVQRVEANSWAFLVGSVLLRSSGTVTARSSGTVTVGALAMSWVCVTIAAEFPGRPVFGSQFGTCLPVLVMRW